MHRYRLLIGTIALLSAAQAAAQQAVICEKRGSVVLAEARDAGLQFNVIESDAAECDLHNASFTVSAPVDRPARCSVRLFAGQPLSNGWSVQRIVVAFNGQGASTDEANMPRTLVMSVAQGKTRLFTIKRVFLRGLDCQSWKDAFR